MKKTYKLIAVIGIAAIGLLIGKQATAQTTNSKIPFQGSLYDQGTPVNGTNSMVFSIAAASWTETHSVQVVNGLYTVVLGSVTPLPANLFTDVDSQQLAITVEGTSIGSVAIYAPFQGEAPLTSHNVTKDISGLVDGDVIEGRKTVLTGNVDVGNTSFYQVGNYGQAATTDGNNVGVFGNANTNSDKWQIGVLGTAGGNGVGPRYGTRGEVVGTNSTYSVALLGYNHVTPPDNATVTGVYGRTFNGATGTQNYGVRARAEGTAGKNIGIFAQAVNSVDENWAGWLEGNTKITGDLIVDGNIIGNVTAGPVNEHFIGTNGYSNWRAGDLAGNGNYGAQLNFNGGLDGSDNLLPGGASIGNKYWDATYPQNGYLHINSPTGAKVVAEAISDGVNEWGSIEMSSTDGSSFGINAYGFTGQISDLVLTNSAIMGDAYDNGVHINEGAPIISIWTGGSGADDGTETILLDGDSGDINITGNLTVNGTITGGGGPSTDLPNLNISDPGIMGGQGFASINIANDGGGADPTGYSAELFLQGKNTPNVQIGGQSWADNNLPFMSLFGSTPDGGGWFHANLSMIVDTDGTFEAGRLGLHKTDIAGQTAETTISLDGMTGNIGIIGSITASNFDLNNGVNGFVNMGAKTWEGNNGQRRGFLHLHGTEDGLPNADAQRVFLEVNDNGSGSYGTLGLKNYEDDGGGNGKVTIDLNGENGSIYLNSGAGSITLDGQNGTISANADVNAAGNMSAVAFNITSDKRYKKNIKTISNALSITEQLRGVTYNWRVAQFKNKNFTNDKQVGLIAQEVEEVLPQLVHTDNDGYKSVNYAQMTAVLIEAVKELNAKVEVLEGENTELKAELSKVDLLEQKIKRFEELLTGSKSNSASLSASK